MKFATHISPLVNLYSPSNPDQSAGTTLVPGRMHTISPDSEYLLYIIPYPSIINLFGTFESNVGIKLFHLYCFQKSVSNLNSFTCSHRLPAFFKQQQKSCFCTQHKPLWHGQLQNRTYQLFVTGPKGQTIYNTQVLFSCAVRPVSLTDFSTTRENSSLLKQSMVVASK